MSRIVIIGGGGHARVLAGVLLKLHHEPLGYTDPQDRGDLLGLPYLGSDIVLTELLEQAPRCEAAIGVGKLGASTVRLELLDRLARLGFGLPVIVSPHAVINQDVDLAPGAVVFDGAVVNSGSRIGRGSILNTHCTVEHDCRLGDDVHIAPGATLSGGVTVGDHTMIGTGACVIQGIQIGSGILVGAGTVVVADLEQPGVYVGNPARRLR